MKMVRAWRHNPRQVYGPGELIYRNQGAPKFPPVPENRQVVEVLGGLPPAPGVTLDATQVFWNPAADTVAWSWYFNGDLIDGESGVTCPAPLSGDYVNVQRGTNADGTGSSSSLPFHIPELPPGEVWTLTVGSRAGIEYGFSQPPDWTGGDVAPAELKAALESLTVYPTASGSAPGRLDVAKLDRTKIEGTWDTLWLDFTNYPGGPVGPLTWSSSNNIYRLEGQTAFGDWMASVNGTDQPFTISETDPTPVVSARTTRPKRRPRKVRGKEGE